jgi:hypothetical protein
MRFIVTVCAMALMTPVPGLSQTSPAEAPLVVDAGSRVRIAAPVFGGRNQVATVVSVTGDSLVLRQGASTTYRSVAKSDITGLEVSRGTHTHKGKGALLGLLIGAGAGAVLGYVSYKEPTCQGFECIGEIWGPSSKSGAAGYGAAVGSILGASVGALLGMRSTDSWVPGTVAAK